MQDTIVFDDIDKYGPQSYDRTLDIPASELDREELSAVGPTKIEAEASKGDLPGEYVVEGTVTFSADLECSRCVEPYPFASVSPFHLRYRARPEGTPEENEEVEITDDELDIEFYSERSIPLRELATAQIQLSIPMKPLCDENCLGLCPKCGANKNRETCECDTSIVDERWGALREFRQELVKKKES